MNDISRTVIINCAGKGSRLGLGIPKALIDIQGKPLIIRQLELLKNESDIRIVVGYKAEQLIKVVNNYRKDIIFVFNHDYETTSTGASLALGAKYAKSLVMSIDGDLVIKPEDMEKALNYDDEFVSGGDIITEEPWLLQTYKEKNTEVVTKFSKNSGNYEWNGIVQVEKEKISYANAYVFQIIEKYLPLNFLKIETREIDTLRDYEKALKWVKNLEE